MTTYSSGNIDSTKILVQAILNVTQDISQGSIVQQHIDIDCSNKSSCNSCLTTAKQYKLDEGGDYSGICRMCYCNLENIDMNRMQSKLHSNIYFAGEILNIDAITGGFNFQAAWTTGYIAGIN